ncbi:MAG: S9 family peptidase [Thermomicrobia bacterium]|nr:S9 family peptidase [Thermomicrobia bacterium]
MASATMTRRLVRPDDLFNLAFIGDVAVSPDGGTICFVQTRMDRETNEYRSDLWTVNLDGAETRLTEGDHDNVSPAWSPDGRAIVFVSKRMADADFTNTTELYIIAATGGEPRRLPTPDGPVDAPAWSPDGTRIAFVGNGRANVAGAVTRLWVIPADGGPARDLTPDFDRNIGLDVSSDSRASLSASRPVWATGSDALFFVASTRGTTPLWRVGLDGGPPQQVVGGTRQVQTFACGGGTLALNLGDSLNPGDVYLRTDADAEPRRLTDANGAFFGTVALAAPESFTYTGAEGWEVQGWLIPPVGVREGEKYPLVLEIHGGPHTAYGEMFFFEFQCLAAQDQGVLLINPRGSTGYGEQFTMASNDDWGGNDYRDLMLGVDAAIARTPWIDGARLGVTGGSFGGYMTNWIITQTDRFAAAVALRSICNMISKWGVSDNGYHGNDRQWGGPPWANWQFYLDRSPLMHVTKVVTPLLLIHSERDLRCPIEQAEQFFTALKYLRREVELVRFPDEGHELSRSGQPLHRLERLDRLTGWFRDHL